MIEEGGCLERYSEQDWVVGGIINWSDIPYPDFVYDDNQYQYNQNEYKRNTCTVYASMGAYSDNFWEEVTLTERKELVDLAIEQWLDTSIGRYIHKAVALVGSYFDVSYARVDANSEDFWEALMRWFTLVYWYRGNREYNDDRDDDWVVQSNDWWNTTYWHAPRLIVARVVDNVVIVDNYEQRASNVYSWTEYTEKMKNWKMFRYGYFYFDKYTPPMNDLPKHLWPEEYDTTLQKDTVKAREREMQVHLANGGKLLWSVYYSDDPRDKEGIHSRYLDDLRGVRPQ